MLNGSPNMLHINDFISALRNRLETSSKMTVFDRNVKVKAEIEGLI